MTIDRLRFILLLSVSALALAACSGKERPPSIAYDDAQMQAAAIATASPKPVEIVEVPKPLPLPGQLQPRPKPARPDMRPPKARVDAANHAALHEPTRDGWIDAVQIYPYTPGALYRLYAAPEQVSDIGLQPGEQLSRSRPATPSAGWSATRPAVTATASRSMCWSNRSRPTSRPISSSPPTGGPITWRWRAPHTPRWRPFPGPIPTTARHVEAAECARRPGAADRSRAGARQPRFRYAITGDSPPWKPVRAFDDGSKVYIEFPARSIRARRRRFSSSVRRRERARQLPGPRQLLHRRSPVRAAELRLGKDPQQVVRISRTDTPGQAASGGRSLGHE